MVWDPQLGGIGSYHEKSDETKAQDYFLEYANDTITYDVLTERGMSIPPEIEFHIENHLMENLTMSVRHVNVAELAFTLFYKFKCSLPCLHFYNRSSQRI